MTKTTITINGRVYDAVTGEVIPHGSAAGIARPMASHGQKGAPTFNDIAPAARQNTPRTTSAEASHVAPAKTHEVHAAAQAVHQTTQKSETLHRGALKRPSVAAHLKKEMSAGPSQRSALISHFTTLRTPEPLPAQQEPQLAPVPVPQEPPAAMHPAVSKILQQHAAAQSVKELSGTELKDKLIQERLAEVASSPSKKTKRASWLSRQPRLVTILSSTLALLILGGYLTYITLPSISLKVAASRAGVNATMPEYKPDGYSLDGPITYSPGEVVISYKSNTNDSGYKLVQKATNWDSQAVLDNYVGKLTDNYLTFQERGITVYTFGSKAAWVNGGLFYTIDGTAALSSDQILRVATSL